jgi:hypothetical protein
LNSLRTIRRFAGCLARACAYAAVAAKLLVPTGYMPGPLAAGLPIQLCDAGFAPVVVHEHAAHGGHAQHGGAQHEHDKASELQWKYCPSGALASAGAIPVEYRIHLTPLDSERLALRDAAGVTRTPFIAFRSRAPPLSSAFA